MFTNVTDRRVQRTRQLLKDSLVSLIIEKGFEQVTIQDILDKANVGRSTFYMHFENKNALLHSCFEEFHELFENNNSAYSGDFGKSAFFLNLFRLVEQKQRLCKALLGRDDMAMFFNPVHKYIFSYIDESIRKLKVNKVRDPLQAEMLVHYLTSALIGMLRWWVYRDIPCNAEEMDRYFRQLANNDIQNLTDRALH